MRFEARIKIKTSAEKIFSLYADVTNWSVWDPDVKSASIDGAFETGSTGK